MSFRGGEFSTGTTGNFQPELTEASAARAATSKRAFRSIRDARA